MGFEGKISDFPISEVIQLISAGRKSGKLTVLGNLERVVIYFHNGNAVYAHPYDTPNVLEDALVERSTIHGGTLNSARLKQTELAKKRENLLVGTILVEMDALPEADMRFLIETEIEECICRIMSEKNGDFDFDHSAVLSPREILASVDVSETLLKCMRRIEEWREVKSAVNSNDDVYCLSKYSNSDIELTVAEWKLITLIDGKRPVSELFKLSTVDRYRIYEIVSRLLESGIIEKAD